MNMLQNIWMNCLRFSLLVAFYNLLSLVVSAQGITGEKNVCPNTSYTYTCDASALRYSWSITGGTIESGAASKSCTVKWLSNTARSLTVTTTAAKTYEQDWFTLDVYNRIIQTGSISGASSVCRNGSVYLSLSGNSGPVLRWERSIDGIAWYSIANATNTCGFYPITANTYFRAVINGDACGVYYTNPWTVNMMLPPVITATSAENRCGTGSVTLKATSAGAATYRWYDEAYTLLGTTITGSFTFNANRSGTFYVSVVGSNGCESDLVPVNVTLLPLPEAPKQPQITRECDYTLLTRAEPPPGFTTHWQYAEQYGSPGDVSPTYTATSAGTYYLRTRNESTGCWSPSTSVNVTINYRPNTPFPPTQKDGCNKVILSRLQPQPGITWYWQTSGGGMSMDNNAPAFIATTSGSYFLRAKDDANGCWSRIAASTQVIITPRLSCLDSQLVNYIARDRITKEGIKTLDQIPALQANDNAQLLTYTDGFGRPIQEIHVQGSPGRNDVVQIIGYDPFGRENKKYLPYTISGSGRFQTDAMSALNAFYTSGTDRAITSRPWSEAVYEASPLHKIVEQGAPGEHWQPGTGKTTRSLGYANAANEVRRWIYDFATGLCYSTGYYVAGDLLVREISDEENRKIFQYSDKEGHLVLESKLISVTEVLQSYWVYDALGKLRMVIQPQGIKELQTIPGNWTPDQDFIHKWCFTYQYDRQGRITVKKMPGAEPVYFVYNKRNQVILMQDGELRKQQRWAFTKYDALKRVIMTGHYNTEIPVSQADMQMQADNWPGQYEVRTAVDFEKGYGYTSNRAWPILSGSSRILTVIYYDDYDFDNNSATTDAVFVTTDMGIAPIPSYETINRITGMRIWVVDSLKCLLTSQFYDKWGNVIQVQSDRYPGGKQVLTMRYDFAGLLQESLNSHTGWGTPYTVRKIYQYDHAGRRKSVQQQVNNGSIITLAISSYNELGQLSREILAPGYNNGQGLDTRNYDYHIRGWLIGVNREYAKNVNNTTGYFGFDLGYDQTAIKTAENSTIGAYSKALYNGEISGTVWKSKGDNQIRKYDYAYDGTGRLLQADFNQYTAGSFNRTAGIDFSVKIGDGIHAESAYDANGNILAMTQQGLLFNTSALIDQLTYSYGTKGNQLVAVADAVNDKNSKLGDLHYNPDTKDSIDYRYDANGNMISDANKGIDTIIYNHLNLPVLIYVKNKGVVEYVYDAMGTRLQKKITDYTVAPARITTTTYFDGAVYHNDTLQVLTHEYGRARYASADTARQQEAKFHYDYFLKDHIGNIRMVITDEQQCDLYPAATMETAGRVVEEAIYSNIAKTASPKPAGYPVDTYSQPNDMVARVNGSGQKIGPSIALKVMAGDTFNIRVNAWYKQIGSVPGEPLNPLPDLLSTLSGSVAPIANKISPLNLQGSPALGSGLLQFLTDYNRDNNSRPKAYLNWILLDEQFRYIPAGSGAEQVGNNEEFKIFMKTGLPVTKNGYLYVYVSNETSGLDVFFDNFQVSHTRGRILEETHYYPFGLTMSGISSRLLKHPYAENKIGIAGKELQSKEFSDDSGLDIYDFGARMYDPQTGKFMMMDPLAEKYTAWSSYNYVMNNPVRFIDPDGKAVVVVVNEASGDKNAGSEQIKPVTLLYATDGKLYRMKDVEFDEKTANITYKLNGVYKGNDKFGLRVKSDMENISGIKSKILDERMRTLQNSPKAHMILYEEGRTMSGANYYNLEDRERGVSTGSLVSYVPDDWLSQQEKKPSWIVLVHELLSHSWDADQGKTDMGKSNLINKDGDPVEISNNEIQAVRVENIARKSAGVPQKTSYNRTEIPAKELNKPVVNK